MKRKDGVMSIFQKRLLSEEEQPVILPLLGGCFPDYWEQLAAEQKKMPFKEISFAAFDGEKAIGHCGIIPYSIMCGGEVRRMAGIASVATHPDYRNRGVAAELCEMAAQWAGEKGFTSLPLYTGFFTVYEKAGWQLQPVPVVRQIVDGKKTAAISWCRGGDLNDVEKANIIKLYENGENFDGKVLRDISGTFHSWDRLFNDPDLRFAAVPKMYAIKVGDVIVELNFDRVNATLADKKRLFYQLGAQHIYLPETAELQEIFCGVELQDSASDAMHGERPMILDIVKNFHLDNKIFFPVADKF